MPKQYFHSLIIKKTLSKFVYLLTDQTEEHNGEQDRDDDVQYGEPEPRIFKQFINKLIVNQLPYYLSNWGLQQGGITCGAIDEPRKSSKAIDERVIINFRDKNGVIARFRDKNVYR